MSLSAVEEEIDTFTDRANDCAARGQNGLVDSFNIKNIGETKR